MENEVIVLAGCDGGDVTLFGIRQDRGWLYHCHLNDSIAFLADEGPQIERVSEVVSTWAAALKLLDKYHFNHLYALTVHPEFRSKVLKAVLSRNMRDNNDHEVNSWHEVCSRPKLDHLEIEMNFQAIQIPKFGSTQGQLLAANPSFSKPSNLTKEKWAWLLLQQVRTQVGEGNKSVLAVPRSFWPLSAVELHEYAASEGVECVDLVDEWGGPRDYRCITPVDSIQEIIDHLQRGKDVIVLSKTKNISDFVPAMLYLVADEHNSHPAKMWCAIAQDVGVELTQFQSGYIYGLINVNDPFGLKKLRNARRAGSSI